MKMQQSRGFYDDGGSQNTRRPHHESAQTGDDAIGRPKVGGPFSASIQNQNLMSHQDGLGNNGTESTRLSKPHAGDDRMQQKSENVPHAPDRTRLQKL